MKGLMQRMAQSAVSALLTTLHEVAGIMTPVAETA
jgi:hypothetical protein